MAEGAEFLGVDWRAQQVTNIEPVMNMSAFARNTFMAINQKAVGASAVRQERLAVLHDLFAALYQVERRRGAPEHIQGKGQRSGMAEWDVRCTHL